MMVDLKVVGRRVTRIDAIEKATGAAVYAPDIRIPGMLVGKVLRSPYPHARILTIDTSRAERLKGVKATVTGREFPFTHGSAWVKDRPFFAIDKVRYVGEPVAAVAAVDEYTAEEALGLIEVEYEELAPIFDPLEAMAIGAPLIHEKINTYEHAPVFRPIKDSNICNYFRFYAGDVEEGFKNSDFIHEDRFFTPMVQHCPMEPHAAVAMVEASGKIVVWTTTCSPFVTRSELAKALGIPFNKIRIISTFVGGAFGSKQGPKVEGYCIALALRTNGRPVKFVHTREEEFSDSLARISCTMNIKTGVAQGGKILAREVRLIWDTGAYSSHSPAMARNPGFSAAGPYLIPNIKVDSYCVYTNKPVCGAMRGFGIPEVSWGIESHMDILAEKIGIDPLEFRLINAVEEGSVCASGEVLHSVGLKESLKRASEGIEWDEKSAKKRGKGIACMHKMTGTPSSSAALVKVNEDGTVLVLASASELGQGSRTILAQIVSEELGIPIENVAVSMPDTDLTPYERSTSSSRTTFHTGNAVKSAAHDAKKQILELASNVMKVPPEYLEIKNGQVQKIDSEGEAISIGALWKGWIFSQQQFPIVGKGIFSTTDGYEPLDPETGKSRKPTAFWIYGAQAAEVEVDVDTGQVEILRIVAAHDVGKAINPLNCEQQIEGSIVMGTGIAMLEELKLDEGKVQNPSFSDYKILTSCDAPKIKSILVEAHHKLGPFGAKGLGEPAFAPTAPAIANAIYNAVGVRIKELPITAEKVWEALKKKNKGKGG